MANMTIPTSRDIYLELNGKKLAVVQGYSAKALRTSREVEAFGESEPVATVGGQTRYTLELSRLYATDEARRLFRGGVPPGQAHHLQPLPLEQHRGAGQARRAGGGKGDGHLL